jgi:hypothetical protein
MSREVTNLECLLMGTVLALCAAVVLLLCGCSTPHYVREINVPAHKLIICDYDTLQVLYGIDKPDVWGCANIGNNIIWCTPQFFDNTKPNTDIYWHEVRHLTEGLYHK